MLSEVFRLVLTSSLIKKEKNIKHWSLFVASGKNPQLTKGICSIWGKEGSMLFTFKNKKLRLIIRMPHSINFCVCLTHGLNLQKLKSKWAIIIKKCSRSQTQSAQWLQTLLVCVRKPNKSRVRERITSKSQLNSILNEARDLEMDMVLKYKDTWYRSLWRSTRALGLQARTSTTPVRERTTSAGLLPGVRNNNYGELFKLSQ